MKPLVSILIPAFNAQKWIADTIKSAVNQTWLRKEIIVVDDGSRDQTLAVARKFASKEVEVVTQSNQGAAAARNFAFSICQGDYVQWLDADDLLAPDKIAKQVEVLDRHPSRWTLLAAAWGRFIRRTHKASFCRTSLWYDLTPMEWLLRKLEDNVYMQTSSWLVSRELTEAAGPWDKRLLQDDDGEYFCRVILASDGVRFVPGAKAFYRQTGGTRLSYIGTSPEKLDALLLSLQLHVRYLRSQGDSERVRAACLMFLQRYLFYFYPERPETMVQLEDLARSLGGQLQPPRLRQKYVWMQELFGWSVAKRTQFVLPECKWSLIRAWDDALFHLENHSRALMSRQRWGRKSMNALP
jgi:glycosyltransferase involved in cell wall biosynthesis